MPELQALESSRGPRKRLDITTVVCGIIYVLHEGIRWRALPEVFGNWKSIYSRFSRWTKSGAIELIFTAISDANRKGELRSLDSSHVKVHQDANTKNQADEAIGMTKGGKNTKVHALVDDAGHAVKISLTPGNINDSLHAKVMSEALNPGETILADKAYDVDALRDGWRGQEVTECIPAKSNRRNPAYHDAEVYKKRHTVENFFQRAKRCRRIGTRYEKTARMFESFLYIFAIIDFFLHSPR